MCLKIYRLNSLFLHVIYLFIVGAGPHDIQAAAGAYGALHNNLPPALNNYPRPPLQAVGYDPNSHMRAPVVPGLGGIPGGKP